MSWEQFVVIDEFGDVLRLQHGSAKGHQAAAAWILTTEKLYGGLELLIMLKQSLVPEMSSFFS
jgi:hypothetical protein